MQLRFGQISERRLGGNTGAYVSTFQTGLVLCGVLSQASTAVREAVLNTMAHAAGTQRTGGGGAVVPARRELQADGHRH